MDTTDGVVKRATRRRHSAQFNVEVLQACRQPDAYAAVIARLYNLNANVVHRWRADDRKAASTKSIDAPTLPMPDFIALDVQPEMPTRNIRVALKRGSATGVVHWPVGVGLVVRSLSARVAALIRGLAVWLATEPIGMRAGMETALARAVRVFGAAQPHHAYQFANRRANRMKVLVHDDIRIWLCARRLHQGRFLWANSGLSTQTAMAREQLDALVLGLS